MNIIDDKIRQFHRQQLLLYISGGILNFLIIACVIWLSTLLVDITFYFSKTTRWFILLLNGSLSIYVLYQMVFINIYRFLRINRTHNYSELTRQIGRYFPEIADRLTNIYQLNHFDSSNTSQTLRDFAVQQFSEEIKHIDFSSKLKFANIILPKHVIFLIATASIVTTVFLYEPLMLSLKRVLVPFREFNNIPHYEFVVEPGNKLIIQGESIHIKVGYSGPQISKCVLQYKTDKELYWQSAQMNFNQNKYSYKIEHVTNQIDYRIQGKVDIRRSWSENIISEQYRINTIIPPRLSELQIEIKPPDYTNLPVQFLDRDIGDIIAYPGSEINISAMVNKELQKAELFFSDSTSLPMVIRENKVAGKFIIDQPIKYRFNVIDKNNIANQYPIEYNITPLEDSYPTVNILEPDVEIESIPDATINLQIEGNDDFGFTGIELYYQIISNRDDSEDSSYTHFNLPMHIVEDKYFLQGYLWDLSNLPIGFDETIKYYIVTWDNDTVRGPKSGRSAYHYIHFPSLQQLFDEFTNVEEENIADLEDIVNENEKVRKELEDIKRALKREKEIEWEKKREIESNIQKQKSIQDRLDQIEQEMERAIEKLAEKNLFSPEILQKYQQLQKLFSEIASPELLQAMEELQKSLESLDKKKVDQALNKMTIDQEQFKKNLERTLELFKKVQLEQEIDQLVQMAKSLLNKQENITNELSDKPSLAEDIKEDITTKQSEQEKDLEQLTKAMESLLKDELFQSYFNAWQKMQETYEQTDQNNMQGGMQNIKQQVIKGQQSSAQQNSKNLEKQMERMMNNLKQSQQAMFNQDKKHILAMMKRTTDNLLNLSKDEENLMRKTEDISNLSDQFREMAQNQQYVSENMGRVIKDIIDLSKETFFISPELSKALGKSQGNMRQGLNALEERNKGSARKHQKQAMASINEAVMEMQNSMQMMSQSSSATGFEQFMKRMQQMAGQQGQLNQQSLDFFNKQGNTGQLSMQQQGELARMAAQQKAIQESMQQLNEEMGERSDILGRMDKMADDMEEVVKDFEALKIDRKTIDRQQRILSRMLDAQKSIREREYSRQRKAEVGKEYTRKRPSRNLNIIDEEKDKLRKDLRRALNEGYTADYEKLIEEYFRELNKELEKN